MEERIGPTDRLRDAGDALICPHCKKTGEGLIIDDYTSRHSRMVLIECGNCENLYKAYYKLEKIVKLIEKE